MRRVDNESNAFVFGYRLVHVAHFADEIRQCDLAEACRSLIFLDFRKPQNGGNDRKRLIEPVYRFVCNHLQLLQRGGAGATALQRQPGTGEWRAQVMRYVIADACKGVDESFHLVEHAVDAHGEFGEGIVAVPMREPFAQIAGDDALHPRVDLDDAVTGSSAQGYTDRKAKQHGGDQAKRERPTNDTCDLPDFIDVSSNHQHVAVRQTSRDQADRLLLPAVLVDPVDDSALYRIVVPEIGWQAFQVTRDPAAV